MELPDSPASLPLGEAVPAPVAEPSPDTPLSASVPPDNADTHTPPTLPDSAAPVPPSRPATRAPQPPDSAALDNARRGIWVMNENHDGWVLLGADRKPVMRKDRSRVSFRFRDAARLAQELAGQDAADASDPVPLAPLDSGYNRDWNPQAQKSFLADITKACRLLAYQYVQFTEPQEAVRRAVSDILQNPTYVKGPRMNAWVPGKFDAEAVKTVAATLLRRVVGRQPGDSEGGGIGAILGADTASQGGLMRGVTPRDRRNLGANFVKVAATLEQANPADSDVQAPRADEYKQMDRLSFRDALEHYAKGNGQPIRIPLNSLDLSGVSASALGNKVGDSHPFTLPGEDGITIGTISLTLIDRNTVRATQGFDTYNFDLKFDNLRRDVMTALGFLVNEGYALGANSRFETGPFGLPIPVTKGGKPYKIYLEGEAKIKE